MVTERMSLHGLLLRISRVQTHESLFLEFLALRSKIEVEGIVIPLYHKSVRDDTPPRNERKICA